MKKFSKLKTAIMYPTVFKRRGFFLGADIVLISLSMVLSFWLRFDGVVPDRFLRYLGLYIGLSLILKVALISVFGLYNISWRFFSLKEVLNLFQATGLAFLILVVAVFFLKTMTPFWEFPRSILILDFCFSFGLLGALRISKRAWREYGLRRAGLTQGRKKVLIVGAGSAGEQIVREMMNNRKSTHFPVGFIDDDENKAGLEIHGIRVLGRREDIPVILGSGGVDEVLIAIPTADSRDIRTIVEIVRSTNKVNTIKVLPGIHEIVEGKVALEDIKEVRVEDLLGREPVSIDKEKIISFLKGKRVLVTGAGGSIGGELARMIATFVPAKLALLDNDETELFHIVNRLKNAGLDLIPIVGSIRDAKKMNAVFEKVRPEIVLHAAALKHVPILEYYPEEAVKTNIMGTRILGEAALAWGAERFVNISTDKAINPTSVMGATKRTAEEILRALNARNGTRFISVRFGNVLGSRGSVIPLFEEQIRKRGPVTVTHPEMKRYFMATSEAVLLVLEAAAMGAGGEAFILDMGKPVRIDDLARDMIRLSGFEPDVDIPIVYSGLRAGEKLYEELLGAEEGTEPTKNQKIFLARNSKTADSNKILACSDKLIDVSESGGFHRGEIISLLQDAVPTYRPGENGASICHW